MVNYELLVCDVDLVICAVQDCSGIIALTWLIQNVATQLFLWWSSIGQDTLSESLW